MYKVIEHVWRNIDNLLKSILPVLFFVTRSHPFVLLSSLKGLYRVLNVALSIRHNLLAFLKLTPDIHMHETVNVSFHEILYF